MNFLLTVCAGFLTYFHQVLQCQTFEFDLAGFMKNFEKSQSELKWIRDQSRENEDKGTVVSSKESNFDEDDESSADLWYNKYRKSECSDKIPNGYCGVADDNNHENLIRDQSETLQTNYVKDFLPYDKIETETDPETDERSDLITPGQRFAAVGDTYEKGTDNNLSEINDDIGLSAQEKLNMEDYNEHMVPNPNSYKINNEQVLNSDQTTQYTLDEGDNYNQVDNYYNNVNSNTLQNQVISRKRSTREYEENDISLPENRFNQIPSVYLNDQANMNKNDLSHEADYKLSKNEQETESQNGYQNNPGNEPKSNSQYDLQVGLLNNHFKNIHRIPNKLSYNIPSNQKSNVMRDGNQHNYFPKKQSYSKQYAPWQGKGYHPANEINLKIRSRMMSKGFGRSSPSQLKKAAFNRMNIDVENQQVNQNWKERHNNVNDFTDYVGPRRRLMQLDYEETLSYYPIDTQRNLVNTKNLLKVGLVQTLNDKKRDVVDTTDKETTSKGSEKKNDVKSGKNEQHSETPIDESSKDPPTLTENPQSVGLQKCINNCKENYKDINGSKQNKDIDQIHRNSTNQKTNGQKSPTKSGVLNNSLSGHVNTLKILLDLDVSNGTHNENTSKKNIDNETVSNEHSNIVKRNAVYEKQYGLHEANIQQIAMNSSIIDLVSGRLPNQLIQAVFGLVKENVRLNKLIGPKLNMKIVNNLEVNSVNLFKSKQKTQRIVKKLMSSITGLIEEQITHQTCISLPPDLQSFYNKVIYVRSTNSHANLMRKPNKDRNNSGNNSSKRFARSTVAESDLHQKYRTVGKLLKQYGHLKAKDQMKIYDMKQYLQSHLELLDDLKNSNIELIRRSRSADNGGDQRKIKLIELDRGVRRISREYANLLKTTKLIKATSLTDMDRTGIVSSYD